MDLALKQFLEAMEKSLKESITSEKSASIERHEELVRKLDAHASKTEELIQWKPDLEHRIAQL